MGTATVFSPKVGIAAVGFGLEMVVANVFVRSQSF